MIERISKCYVSDNCVQVRVSFNDVITLISSDFKREGILCHYDLNDDSQNVNKYLLDDRRKFFPYSNIPIYKEWYGNFYDGFYKTNYINQILEFNKHYITVVNGIVKDRYVVRDGDEAIVYSRVIKIPSHIEEKIIGKNDFLYSFKDNVIFCIDNNGHYIDFKNNFRNFVSCNGGLLVVNNNGNINFKLYDIDVEKYTCFVKEYTIPFNDYKLEEFKGFESKFKTAKEPKIYKYINPNIDRSEIKEAKKKVRRLNQSR